MSKHSARTAKWRRIARTLIDQVGCCQECGSTEDLTVDHIVPARMLEGEEKEALNNLRVLCRSCNSAKGDKISPPSRYISEDERVQAVFYGIAQNHPAASPVFHTGQK